MGGPSTTDFTPLPVEERIDDSVEAPVEDVDASDDEGLYNTNAPLLSNRSRGNGTPSTQLRSPFLAKLSRCNPFRRSLWTSNTKRSSRSWFNLFITSLIALLITTVIALSISTGILASRTASCPPSYRRYWRPTTHLPLNNGPSGRPQTSYNNALNFPAVYPPLTSHPGSACQTAWNTLTDIPCHEKIWNRSWDNGRHESLFDPDISMYASAMCSSRCTQAIQRAYRLIMSQCTADDKFALAGYIGSFSADRGLEDGPIGVIATIERRLQHTCRQSPFRERFQYYTTYCVAEMYLDWFVVDGMNTANLEGLEYIKAKTSAPHIEPRHYRSFSFQDDCDNVDSYTNNRIIEERHFGPGINQTSCGWCTMDWLDRKLQSWAPGEISDPDSTDTVSLEDYLLRIKDVGQRCNTDDWNRVYGKAIRKYKDEGLLPPDWEDDGKKPCSDKAAGATPVLAAVVLPATPF
ncbi:hypothetical protein K432DRAFT_385246 [Lepidopterella palustris CBS 459.81]|uniref:Uncharacterized protein n=1 Tax=Lepidopterella palustris CBS 459.81 TaxID=1314670 RepID=A0A8E2JC74_9PEZI|nr:hypothetical protein K432DRAFT_385246 [Lepidopterella palustris CBS 459.81]